MDAIRVAVKKIIKGALLLVLATILGYSIALGIGFVSPEDDTFNKSKSYHVSNEVLWNLITDIEKYPEWKPNVSSVDILGYNAEGKLYWRENLKDGGSQEFVIDYQVKPVSLQIKQVDKDQAITKTRLFEINTHNNSTILTVKDTLKIKKPFLRYRHRFVDPSLESEIDYFLLALNEYSKSFVTE